LRRFEEGKRRGSKKEEDVAKAELEGIMGELGIKRTESDSTNERGTDEEVTDTTTERDKEGRKNKGEKRAVEIARGKKEDDTLPLDLVRMLECTPWLAKEETTVMEIVDEWEGWDGMFNKWNGRGALPGEVKDLEREKKGWGGLREKVRAGERTS